MTPTRLVIIGLALFAIFLGPSMVGFYTDWLWFGEVGYQPVYVTMLRTQGTLFVAGFVAATAWLMLNLRIAIAGLGDVRPVFTTREGLEVTLPGRRQIQTVAPIAALLGGVLIGLRNRAQTRSTPASVPAA